MKRNEDCSDLVEIVESYSRSHDSLMSLDELIRKHGQIVKLAIKNGSWRSDSKIRREVSTLKCLLELKGSIG